MRSVLLAVLFFGSIAASEAQELPQFNIEATCRAAPPLQGGIQDPYPSCMREETAARADLQRLWTTFSAEQRGICVRETRIEGSPSYVEVLTCLQMSGGGSSPQRAPRGTRGG